jgi:amidophosphoribosyltransferase
VSFSGNVINAAALIREMMERGTAFWRGYNVEILAKIILEKKDTLAGLTALAEKIQGACSLVVLSREGIYATRDAYGFRPLILGQGRGKYAVSSESRALQNLDFEVLRDVRPGEIVLINEHGFNTLKQLPSPRRAYCAFEWAYTASIDSCLDGLCVLEARNNLGARLAERDEAEGGLAAFVEALKIPREDLCLKCWDGIRPQGK